MTDLITFPADQLDLGSKHKPIIETLINTTALAITAYGANMIMTRDYYGFICVGFAALLEYFKYLGRHKRLW